LGGPHLQRISEEGRHRGRRTTRQLPRPARQSFRVLCTQHTRPCAARSQPRMRSMLGNVQGKGCGAYNVCEEAHPQSECLPTESLSTCSLCARLRTGGTPSRAERGGAESSPLLCDFFLHYLTQTLSTRSHQRVQQPRVSLGSRILRHHLALDL